MTDQAFDAVRQLVREHSAVALDDTKQYLVEARLAPLVRERNLGSIDELVGQHRCVDEVLQRRIVEALLTTESSFFRDHHPFEALRQVVLPALIERRRGERRLNIWCAAAAHGQEPYSVSLLLREHFPQLLGWKIGLLASDVSQDALNRARQGRFNQIEVNRGLPATLLVRYFEQHGTDWQLQASVREMVEFREINLAKPWPILPPMDLVLIRNVMIYFAVETKVEILRRLERVLRPAGYLMLGGAETTINLNDSFQRVEPLRAGLYQMDIDRK